MNDYWREIFGWSWSRQQTWDDCKLRYYYNYIGKWEGFKGDLRREKLQWLSKKTDSVMLQGSLVHEAIESQINQWSISRPPVKDAAKSLFSYRLNKIRHNPKDYLIDDINGFPVPSEKFNQIETDGLSLLDAFFDIVWPNYQNYEYIKHEQLDSFEFEDLKIWVKVDLVTKMQDGTYVITDWKTGKVDESRKEQLFSYILWAMQTFGVNETRIRGEVRYLREPGSQPTLIEASVSQLRDFSSFISQSAHAMLAVDSETNFPASPSDRNCKRCPFASVCPSGMTFIPSQSRGESIIFGES